MAMVNAFSPGTPVESPYAAELQRGRKLRFTPELEAKYLRAHLLQNRTLIRITCSLTTILLGLRGMEQMMAGAWDGKPPVYFAVVFLGSIVLAAIAWGAAFERMFLQCANYIVPIRNAIMAAQIAEVAAHGQLDVLMALPLALMGPFFFLGLRFRTALLSGAMTTAAFIACAIHFELAAPVAVRAGVMLLMGLAACSLATFNREKWSRTSFLQAHLTAEQAQNDALTGTKNRRVFDEHLARLWPQAIQDERTIAVLLIDVDHFKAYNDSYGHQAGDRTLRQIAQTIQTFIGRPLDIMARYGGEEFVALVYDVDVAGTMAMADRIRAAVEELAVEHRASPTFGAVTISIGVAIVAPTRERNPRGALQLADQALYEAKLKGRNRVELMSEVEYRMLVTGIFSTTA